MKKHPYYFLLAGILIVIAIFLLALNVNQKSPERSFATEQSERDKQTLWVVLDESGETERYLPENQEDVMKIMQIISEHCSVVDNRSFQDVGYAKEIEYYAKEFQDNLDNSSYEKSLKSMYEDNELVIKGEGISWYVNYFNTELTTCKVTIDSSFQIGEGQQNYLNANGLEKNVTYLEQRTYYLEKTDDLWQITNIDKSQLNKKAQI